MDYFDDFLGTGWSFPPTFSKAKKGVDMVSGEEDIRQSLQIILNTQVGERFLQPDFGADLQSFVYESINGAKIKDMIFKAIYLFEPRIQPESVEITDVLYEGKLLLEIQYIIKATNSRHNMVYPFYINEGTLIG